ncbi:MAG TPA: hypothetical protein PKW21_00375 [Rhabdaerophilum sp.]|nr:hypothetical protein [Rhabdaerophilum sp.]
MSDHDQREALLRRDGFLIAIAGLSLLCGMNFSPYFEPGFILLRPVLVNLFITSPLLVFYFTSLFLGLAAVAIAGVPAAIYERMTGQSQSDSTSLMIWLAGCALLAMPPILRLVGVW